MKKKIFIVALVVCIMAISIASASIAYFTDTESATNTFTAGNVEIQLTEINASNAKQTINDVATTIDYGTLYPGKSVEKDPTIVVTGSETAYLGAIITIENTAGDGKIGSMLVDVDNNADDKVVAIDTFLSGLVSTDATVKYVPIKDGDVTTGWTVYIIMTQEYSNVDGNNSVKLFDNVIVPASWDNDEMAHCKNLSISVKAYAVQTAGFADADAAFKAAFGTEFKSYFA